MSEAPLSGLIARCEAATGPTTELDAYIHLAVTPSLSDAHVRDGSGWIIGGTHDQPTRAPNYSFSIDTALTLVPDDFAYTISACRRDAVVTLFRIDTGARHVTRKDGNVPLAICEAALRARLAMEGSG